MQTALGEILGGEGGHKFKLVAMVSGVGELVPPAVLVCDGSRVGLPARFVRPRVNGKAGFCVEKSNRLTRPESLN